MSQSSPTPRPSSNSRSADPSVEQRIQLGLRLLQAAEAQTKKQQSAIELLRQEQARMKEQIEKDVAKSLQTYDQWVGQIDERFTQRLKSLEDRLSQLQDKWHEAEDRIDSMMQRAEAVLDQGRSMVESAATAQRRRTPEEPRTPPKPIGLKPKALPAPQPQPDEDAAVEAPVETEAEAEGGTATAVEEAEPDAAPSPGPQEPVTPSMLYSQILSRLRKTGTDD